MVTTYNYTTPSGYTYSNTTTPPPKGSTINSPGYTGIGSSTPNTYDSQGNTKKSGSVYKSDLPKDTKLPVGTITRVSGEIVLPRGYSWASGEGVVVKSVQEQNQEVLGNYGQTTQTSSSFFNPQATVRYGGTVTSAQSALIQAGKEYQSKKISAEEFNARVAEISRQSNLPGSTLVRTAPSGTTVTQKLFPQKIVGGTVGEKTSQLSYSSPPRTENKLVTTQIIESNKSITPTQEPKPVGFKAPIFQTTETGSKLKLSMQETPAYAATKLVGGEGVANLLSPFSGKPIEILTTPSGEIYTESRTQPGYFYGQDNKIYIPTQAGELELIQGEQLKQFQSQEIKTTSAILGTSIMASTPINVLDTSPGWLRKTFGSKLIDTQVIEKGGRRTTEDLLFEQTVNKLSKNLQIGRVEIKFKYKSPLGKIFTKTREFDYIAKGTSITQEMPSIFQGIPKVFGGGQAGLVERSVSTGFTIRGSGEVTLIPVKEKGLISKFVNSFGFKPKALTTSSAQERFFADYNLKLDADEFLSGMTKSKFTIKEQGILANLEEKGLLKTKNFEMGLYKDVTYKTTQTKAMTGELVDTEMLLKKPSELFKYFKPRITNEGFTGEDLLTMGKFNPQTNEILINKTFFEANPEKAISTYFHEVAHKADLLAGTYDKSIAQINTRKGMQDYLSSVAKTFEQDYKIAGKSLGFDEKQIIKMLERSQSRIYGGYNPAQYREELLADFFKNYPTEFIKPVSPLGTQVSESLKIQLGGTDAIRNVYAFNKGFANVTIKEPTSSSTTLLVSMKDSYGGKSIIDDKIVGKFVGQKIPYSYTYGEMPTTPSFVVPKQLSSSSKLMLEGYTGTPSLARAVKRMDTVNALQQLERNYPKINFPSVSPEKIAQLTNVEQKSFSGALSQSLGDAGKKFNDVYGLQSFIKVSTTGKSFISSSAGEAFAETLPSIKVGTMPTYNYSTLVNTPKFTYSKAITDIKPITIERVGITSEKFAYPTTEFKRSYFTITKDKTSDSFERLRKDFERTKTLDRIKFPDLERINGEESTKIKDETLIRIKDLERIASPSRSTLKTKTATATKTETLTRVMPRIIPRVGEPRIKTPEPIAPLIPWSIEFGLRGVSNKWKSKKKLSGFSVFSRVKGKKVKLAGNLPKNLATAVGKRFTATTTARSFTIAPEGITNIKDIPPINLNQYRQPKVSGRVAKEGFTFVEKSRFAIDTIGEKKGLKLGKLNKFKGKVFK